MNNYDIYNVNFNSYRFCSFSSESGFVTIELPETVILTGFTLKIINIINVQLPTSSSDSFKLSDIWIRSKTK